MRVLMETFKGRKGYKYFDNVDDFSDFMTQYNDKITNLQILEDGENIPQRATLTADEIQELNNYLKDLIEKCKDLTREVAMVFCSHAKSHDEYKSILKASSKIMKAIPLLRSCIK